MGKLDLLKNKHGRKTTRTINIFNNDIALTGYIKEDYFNSATTSPNILDYEILKLLKASMKPSGVMLDVGANIGYVSIPMAKKLKKSKLIVFEPHPLTIKLLKRNIKQNHCDNIEVFQLGLGAEKADVPISYPLTHLGGAFISDKYKLDVKRYKSSTIHVNTLDNLIKDDLISVKRCDVIKVDIEGYELDFLKGAESFIKKYKPFVVLEANHWCLNAFRRITMPDFIDALYNQFKHVIAFDGQEYIDLSNDDKRHYFFERNIIHSKFRNIYCGFNKSQMIENLKKADIVSQI